MTEKDKLQEEIIRIIEENNYNGAILSPTGTGKGRVMVEIIKKLNPNSILYTCDNKDLRDNTFRDEVIKWGGEEYLDRIEMQCYQTTYKWKDRYYDLLIGDEGDFSLTPAYKKLYLNNTFNNILIFSGTLSEDKENVLQKIVPIIYRSEIKEAEDRGVINKAKVNFVTYRLTTMEEEKYLNFNKRFKALIESPDGAAKTFRLKSLQLQRKLFLQNLNSSREATRKLLKQLYNDHKNKILVFCGSTEQADRVCRWSYHGKNEGLNFLNQFKENLIRVLSVCSKIDRGTNIKGVNNVIFECPDRSKTRTNQRSGRSRRLNVDEVTNLYFMIPYYRTTLNQIKPTIVFDYVIEGAADLDLSNVNYINIDI